jgi:hypothetical protein
LSRRQYDPPVNPHWWRETNDPGRWRQVHLDTCYHEAAHAVLDASVWGVQVKHVRADEHLTVCWTRGPAHPWQSQAFALAANLLAAEMSAYKRRGKNMDRPSFEEFVEDVESYDPWDYPDDEPPPDDVQALRLLGICASGGDLVDGEGWVSHDDYSDSSLRMWFEEAWSAAEQEVEEHWPEIIAVAEQLAESGYLTGEECVRIAASAKEYQPED